METSLIAPDLDAVVPCKGLRLNEALKVATEMG